MLMLFSIFLETWLLFVHSPTFVHPIIICHKWRNGTALALSATEKAKERRKVCYKEKWYVWIRMQKNKFHTSLNHFSFTVEKRHCTGPLCNRKGKREEEGMVWREMNCSNRDIAEQISCIILLFFFFFSVEKRHCTGPLCNRKGKREEEGILWKEMKCSNWHIEVQIS